jgi:hypothetical protein
MNNLIQRVVIANILCLLTFAGITGIAQSNKRQTRNQLIEINLRDLISDVQGLTDVPDDILNLTLNIASIQEANHTCYVLINPSMPHLPSGFSCVR